MKWSLYFLLLSFRLYSAPIIINEPSDYHILDQFFRRMIQEEVFGHVLEGVKPLSALNHYSTHSLLFPHSPFFQWSVLTNEAIQKWKKLAPENKDYVFKITDTFNHNYGGSYQELLFINRKKLKETVNDNINLFRLILGPTLEPDVLETFIADSSKSLNSIIKSNNTLMGILLGYGTYNSLMGGRLEEIEGAHHHLDQPPFISDHFSQQAQNKIDWNLQNYFLSSIGTESHLLDEKSYIEAGLGCSSLEEERDKILSYQEKIPTNILKERPAFIFGAYKDDGNQLLFKKITSSQKRIQALLSKSDLLEYVLEKITRERPIINCDITSSPYLSIHGNAEEAVAKTLINWAQELDKETVSLFIEAFFHYNHENQRPKCRYLSGMLDGLKIAQAHLKFADEELSKWSQIKELKEIDHQGLYFQILTSGNGKFIGASTDVKLSYVIEDGCGNTLTAHHNCWIDLSQTIPAFAHGMNGMQEGETRKIYIHPKYGYGALTTLSPCVSLIVKVTLHEVNDLIHKDLVPLKPIDLSWVKDQDFYEEVKNRSSESARYLGSLWGVWLSKSRDINFSKLCDLLKKYSQETPKLTNEEKLLANRVFWNRICITN